MQPVKTINFSDTLSFCCDNGAIYLLSPWKGEVLLSTFNPWTMKVTSSFSSALPFNQLLQIRVDDSCVYIPTMQGEIIGIDKFSGEKVVHCDLGMMTMVANVEQNDSHLYTICGVPIMNGLKTDTESLCITSSDKVTGKKSGQSSSIKGRVCPLSLDDHVWGLFGKTLYKYSPACEKINQTDVQFLPNYRPVIADNFVCSASSRGSLEVFHKDSVKSHVNFILEKNKSSPVTINNKVYWFLDRELKLIDLDTKKVSSLYQLKHRVRSTPVVFNETIHVTDDAGNLITIKDNVSSLQVANEIFGQPMVYDDFVVLVSKDNIYRIDI